MKSLNLLLSGLMLPLTTANLLAPAIVGSALENMDMERLIREVGMAVGERVHGNNESVDDVAKELHEKLLLRNALTSLPESPGDQPKWSRGTAHVERGTWHHRKRHRRGRAQ